jgi:lysozyme
MRRTLAALVAATLIMLGLGAPGAGAYSNGKLPPAALSPIASGVKCDAPAGQLSNEASAAYNSMALASGEKLPVKLPTNGCDSAYRPYERQVYYWALYRQGVGNLAAYPGTSNHGWGLAVDIPEWVQGYLKLHGARFCWRKTEAFSEPWHWNYTGCFNRPNPGTNLHSPTLRQHSGGPGQGIYVRKVQKLLRGHGDKLVSVDGDFGWQTRKAVERFQKAERIKVTGLVNRRTWKRLRQPVAKPVKTTPKAVPPAPAQPAPKAPEVKKPKPRKPKNRPAWGIDVSSNNGPVNFKAVRRDGADFACVKASEGQDYIDHGFSRKTMRAVGAAGLVPCAYHYLRPRGDRPGAREAAWFTQVIGQAGYGKGWLPPVLDVEETELGPAATCRYVGSFLRLIRRNLGVRAIVYTFPSFAATNFTGCSWLGKYRRRSWGRCRRSPWQTYAMWQYTWTGRVAGVSGDVDVNKVRGGRNALVDLRVKKLPRRARRAPRARLELPLEAEPKRVLRKAAPDPKPQTKEDR